MPGHGLTRGTGPGTKPREGPTSRTASAKVADPPSTCYCDPMKNITVTVDEETYRGARIKAAELDTSVSALVKRYLT